MTNLVARKHYTELHEFSFGLDLIITGLETLLRKQMISSAKFRSHTNASPYLPSGATGATGRLVIQQFLQQLGVMAIARNKASLDESCAVIRKHFD